MQYQTSECRFLSNGGLTTIRRGGYTLIAREDPHLLELRDEIALLQARQQQTLAGLGMGESGEAWRLLAEHMAQLREAWHREDDSAVDAVIAAMDALLQHGAGEQHVWTEFAARAEQIRTLVDTERKYREGLKLYLPLERAHALFNVWLDCIRRTVPAEYIERLRDEVRKARAGEWPSGSPGGSRGTYTDTQEQTAMSEQQQKDPTPAEQIAAEVRAAVGEAVKAAVAELRTQVVNEVRAQLAEEVRASLSAQPAGAGKPAAPPATMYDKVRARAAAEHAKETGRPSGAERLGLHLLHR